MDLNQLLHQHQLALLIASKPMSVKDKRASAALVTHYESDVRDYREGLGLDAYRRNASLIDMTIVLPEPGNAGIRADADIDPVEAAAPVFHDSGHVRSASCSEPTRLQTLAELGIVHRIVDMYEIGGVSHTNLADALTHARRLKRN